MYHLARALYLQWTSKPEYSIILLGLDNAGKTTLMSQIKALFNTTASSQDAALGATGDLAPSSTAGNTVPTVGQNVATIDLPDMYIKIWDVGGQLTLRRLWTSYYKSAHAVVFVVDSTDLGSGDVEDLDGGGIGGIGGVGGGVGGGKSGRGWVGRKKSYNFGTSPDHQQDYQLRRHSSVKSIDETTLTAPETPQEQGQQYGRQQQQQQQQPVTPGTPMTPWTPMSPLMANLGRLEECKAVLESVLSHEDTAGIPILVLANKQDREDCLEVVRIKEGFVRKVFEGEKGGMVRDSRVLPVSALKGTGVKEAVEWVKSRVLWNKDARPPVMR